MASENDFRVGGWLVRRQLNTIERQDDVRTIEPKVMEVLAYLARHPGEVLPKEQIIQAVWPDTFVGDEVLTYSISELRKAFEDDAKNPRFIQTIPRRGYRLIAPVRLEEPLKLAGTKPVPDSPSGSIRPRLPCR